MAKETELNEGDVVYMKASSGMPGYGNAQCISWVCEDLGELSFYGHNQHYKTYDVEKVVISRHGDKELVGALRNTQTVFGSMLKVFGARFSTGTLEELSRTLKENSDVIAKYQEQT